MTTSLELRQIEDLVTRVDAQLNQPGGRIIGFIASGSGEGTSTLARAYATTVISHLRRRVLLLSASEQGPSTPGVLPALVAGQALEPCLQPLAGSGFFGSLGGPKAGDVLWELLAVDSLWQDLRSRFDEVVLDLPAASVSRLGLMTAPHCDGVVVVIEAEKTRAPVAENLIASLHAVKATVLGTVLNRRRFYLPKRVYRWL
ncbi:MAG: hypothetical protein PHQ58_09260 [Rhodoferax sp.]|uniref:hypothetical protein n=1 Tax=Rhodoferax sp. TaxID=50421 RepID=UPI002602D604|nr:hypothetical protein [Rhodoferax sp.]MDD2880614.1 hypothetical protein [Rhodoferax sp.]